MLRFVVNGQKLKRADSFTPATDSKGYLQAVFDFSADWAGTAKAALFQDDVTGEKYHVTLDSHGLCDVPSEVLVCDGAARRNYFALSVYGVSDEIPRVTTNEIRVDLARSGYGEASAPADPTPDVYEQLLAQYATAQEQVKYVQEHNIMTRPNLIQEYNEGYYGNQNAGLQYYDGAYHTQPIYLLAGDVVYYTYSSIYGENRYCFKYVSETQNGARVNNLREETDYNMAEIQEAGYYVFNTVAGGSVALSMEGLAAASGCYLPDDILNHPCQSPLTGKRLSVNGDSICLGAGYAGGYAKLISDTYGMTYENLGQNGATIAAGTYSGGANRWWICQKIANMDANADYVLIEGGVNDANISVELGTISTGYSAELDTATYYGAFEYMCKALLSRFAGKKVAYIAVHKMVAGYDSTQQENSYYYAAKKCCEKWGIPFCDLNSQLPPIGHIDSLKTAYTLNGDGWHPNEDGYRLYYVPRIVSFMESL